MESTRTYVVGEHLRQENGECFIGYTIEEEKGNEEKVVSSN